MTNIAITMAGASRRFEQAGYTAPKYRLRARGRTLFAWSVGSLEQFSSSDAQVVFVTQAQHESASFIREQCRELKIHAYKIVELDGQTDGQATTAMKAGPALEDRRAPFLIYNIDTRVEPSALSPARVRGDGWIPCFPGEGCGWSFVRADEEGRIREIHEKVRISEHATIGLYWFSSFELYRESYQRHFAEQKACAPVERYIAPIYNTMIRSGRAVYMEELSRASVFPLGTPDELARFESRA